MANDDRNPTDQDLDTAGLDNTPGTGSGLGAARSMSAGGGVSGMSSSPGGTSGSGPGTGAGADLDETPRAAQDATARLRADFDIRGGSGNENF